MLSSENYKMNMENTFFKEDTPYEYSYYTLEEIEHLEQVDKKRCETDSKVRMSILKLLADDIWNNAEPMKMILSHH